MDDACYYRISVKGISIDDTGRFLLAREDNGRWDMIGGGLEHGEEPVACLRREIMEETGLKVTYISPMPKYFITGPRHSGNGFVANLVYEVKLAGLEFTPSEECRELRHFTPEEARREKLYPTVANFADVFDPKLHV